MSERSSSPEHDAVVIGSGFGGSIAALRLSEAGKSVLVLERGRRWRPGDFPRDVRDVDRLLWRWPHQPGARGLYDVRFFSGLGAVVASGVGGGSLIYANIHIRPDPVVFEDPRWPPDIRRNTLDPYYDRVRDMLGMSPLPEDRRLPKRDAFRGAARNIGREVFDPDQAVSWQEPAVAGRSACKFVAECEFGCQHGAKNTADLTYLARAEARHARVAAHCVVETVEPLEQGCRVSFRDLTTGRRESVSGRIVVLAAGTLGTNEILLRSRAAGLLPRISARLGHGYSANGDFLGSIMNTRTDLEPWNGTDVTSVIRFFETPPQFTMAAPTFNRVAMTFLAALGQPNARWISWAGPLLWRWAPFLLPLALKSGLLGRIYARAAGNEAPAAHMTNLFAIGRDNANGVMTLQGDRLDIAWSYAEENRTLIEAMQQAMRDVADAYGGSFSPLVTWLLFKRILTVHSLGGCHLSDTPDRGVVSPLGEVHGHPRLFVADGSVVPSSIGFHPCMTIAAIAERIAEDIVRQFGVRFG